MSEYGIYIATVCCALYVGYFIGFKVGKFAGFVAAATVFHTLCFGPRPRIGSVTDTPPPDAPAT